jgi:hypothetical protein
VYLIIISRQEQLSLNGIPKKLICLVQKNHMLEKNRFTCKENYIFSNMDGRSIIHREIIPFTVQSQHMVFLPAST